MKVEGEVRRYLLCALVFSAATGAAMTQQNQAPGAAQAQTPDAAQTERRTAAADQQGQGTQNQATPIFVVRPDDAQIGQETVTIHAITRRVIVDVVVRGPDGKPVAGLVEE